MKVIKRGTWPPAETVWRGTCRDCGCIAEAEFSELTVNPAGTIGAADCPTCCREMLFEPTSDVVKEDD